ncbi:MAG: amino acid permease [Actinobacteria bacterium HGW-Actinobacteria-1]|jgi:amino acid transporter|nr:MAG: amino acid permease [Actinobacteria bacterium HGW-Actinobacteria-1]
MPGQWKTLLLGDPLDNSESQHQRLSNPVALAVFSSDALSSVAYATEEILLMLVLAGSAALTLAMPIAIAIGVLLLIVATSYRQTIKAYPGGGGAYIVAKENLGENVGLVAGASLLIDYILTVAVSISAGTAAVTSAFPSLAHYRVEIAVGFTILLAVANLRGVKESGTAFAGPTYFFVAMLGLLIVVGLVKTALGHPIVVTPHEIETTSALSLFIILKAFASGCTAMTGVEAIANGVQAFKEPEAKNASKTLAWMAGILLFMFIGITALATISGVRPTEGGETVVSQLARGVFGTNALYYMLQAATAAILVLAANTSYADFPRLGSFIAADGFLPKQLKQRGYRLVYSNGIMLLTAVAVMLLIVFGGNTNKLIPLYALGVFASFTMSQTGMVIHWLKNREANWHWSIAVNGLGAATTCVVFFVIAAAKFSQGAWIVLLLAPILVMYFKWIKAHYDDADRRLALMETERDETADWLPEKHMRNQVVLLVSGIDRRIVRAVRYAHTIKAESIQAVFVDVTGDKADFMREEWKKAHIDIPLTIIDSPYREIIGPIVEYIRAIPRTPLDDIITVIVPEFVPEGWVDNMLHDQTSFWLKRTLFAEEGVVVTDIPYRMRPHLVPSDEQPTA